VLFTEYTQPLAVSLELLCSSCLTARGCDKPGKASGAVNTYKARFPRDKKLNVDVCKNVLEFGNTDFHLQVVVNLRHLSGLNSLQSCCSSVSPFFLLWKLPCPSGQNHLAAPTLQTTTFGFGLHAKLPHPITAAAGVFFSHLALG